MLYMNKCNNKYNNKFLKGNKKFLIEFDSRLYLKNNQKNKKLSDYCKLNNKLYNNQYIGLLFSNHGNKILNLYLKDILVNKNIITLTGIMPGN